MEVIDDCDPLDNIPLPGVGSLKIFFFCRWIRELTLQMQLLQACLSNCENVKSPVLFPASCILTEHHQSHDVASIVNLEVSIVIVCEHRAGSGGG